MVPGGAGALPQGCSYRAGRKNPQGDLEAPRLRQGPCSPAAASLQTANLAPRGRQPLAALPQTPRWSGPRHPSAPEDSDSGRFLAFRPVPELSPLVPLGEGWKQPAAANPAVPQPPASSPATSLCRSSQQRKHVTLRAKTLSVTDPWPIRVGVLRPGEPREM